MTHIKTAVVVPNWNGRDSLGGCLESLVAQARKATVIVVDNGSTDGSAEFVEQNFPNVVLIRHQKNLGFTGGVNAGIRKAMEMGAQYVALLNNDAVADKGWLRHLIDFMDTNPGTGIATSKICDLDKTHLDSTGDIYTIWGLPFPRGRGEEQLDKYDNWRWVFGASGGASIYRVEMLRQIGLFDEDFFAYYEDVDISFRAQLAGWKVAYEPWAVVYHAIGATSGKIRGFTTYHTIKNLPFVFWKNVPAGLLWKVFPRLLLAYSMFFGRALSRGQIVPAFKGFIVSGWLTPKKLLERRRIQKARKVPASYINSIIVHDLPPNAYKLRALRNFFWKLTGRKSKIVAPPLPKVAVHRPKIVIDARESGTSTGRYIDKLVEYLHALEPYVEMVILAKSHRQEFFKNIAPGFEVVESNFKEFTFAEQTGLLKQLNGLGADLVHFGMTQQPVRYKGRAVTTVHDLTTVRFSNPAKNPLIYKIKQRIYKWVIKKVTRQSAAIITPSQYVKNDLVNFAHINPAKVEVTYEAADHINEPPEPVEVLKDKRFVMYVGRPTPHKNLERLVEAFSKLVEQDPQLKLALVGKADTNYERIKQLVSGYGLGSSVIFTGFASEGQLRWMYEHTLAYVFPSLSEGFGLPGLEAMRAGAPVVSSNATCLPEIYGEAAYYFNPGDVEHMAARIREVITSPDFRQELIKLGKTQADKYSWAAMAEQTLEIYKKILS